MRKLIVALALALSLGACAQLQNFQNAITAVTVGVNNPITKQDLYNFENGMTVVFAGLNAYKRACVQGAVDAKCKDNIHKIQVYTQQVPPLLRTARAYVKNNDQVNARIAYNTLVELYNEAKAIAISSGVQVQ